MRKNRSSLLNIFLGLLIPAVIIGVIGLIVVYSDIIGAIIGFIWGIIAFIIMLAMAVIAALAPFFWVKARLDSDEVNPQAVVGLGIPVFLVIGFFFTLGASYTYPDIGKVTAPFICPEGYENQDVGRFYVSGQTSEGTSYDYSGSKCSGEKGKFRPGRYAYPLVMMVGFTIFAMTLLVASEVDDILLRGRISSFWRLQMLFILGVILIAILVFQPPPVSNLARIIQPLIN